MEEPAGFGGAADFEVEVAMVRGDGELEFEEGAAFAFAVEEVGDVVENAGGRFVFEDHAVVDEFAAGRGVEEEAFTDAVHAFLFVFLVEFAAQCPGVAAR